jgi:adenylate cyclase
LRDRSQAVPLFVLVVALLTVPTRPAHAQIQNRSVNLNALNLAPHLSYYHDAGREMVITDVQTPAVLAQFRGDGLNAINRGFETGALWTAVDLHNRSSDEQWYVVLSYPLLDVVDVYVESPTGQFTRYERTGDSRSFVGRVLQVPQLTVPIVLTPKSTSRLFIRLQTDGALYAPITLHRTETLLQEIADQQTRTGLYFGGLLILALYNLLLFLYFRQSQYLVFGGLSLALVTWFMGETGLIMQYVFPDSPAWCNRIQILSICSMSALGFQLNYVFLRETLSPAAIRMHKMARNIAIVFIVLGQFLHYGAGIRCGLSLISLYILSSFYFSLRALLAGYLPARMFFLSMLFLIFGGLLTIMRDLGLLTPGPLTSHGPLLGVGAFILLLSLSLTDQISLIQKTKEALSASFSKFVPKRLVTQLMESGRVAHLGGEAREVTLIFSDIRGYSTISENMDPTEVIGLLTEYFDAMQASVESNGGVILEYIGDGILAVFGAPGILIDHPKHAVLCSIDMQAELKALNVAWEKRGVSTFWQAHGIDELSIRIGVHTGKVIAGNLGSQQTMKYGVVGDTVNVASRLEQLNNRTDTSILISEEVYQTLDPDLKARTTHQGQFVLKGRNKSQSVYSIGNLVASDVAGLQSLKAFSVNELKES